MLHNQQTNVGWVWVLGLGGFVVNRLACFRSGKHWTMEWEKKIDASPIWPAQKPAACRF